MARTNEQLEKLKVATPARLRDGSWGARVYGDPEPGDIVAVETRSGKRFEKRVTSVIWRGDDKHTGARIALCETEDVL